MENNQSLTDEQLSLDNDMAKASGEAKPKSQGQIRAKHDPEKKLYELLYIVSNQYTENELEQIRTRVDGILAKYGATIVYQEFLGKRRLAYPIDKVNHGYYLLTEFDLADNVQFQPLNHELRFNKEIVRFQIIIKPRVAQEAPVKKHFREPLEAKPETKERPAKAEKKNMKNLDEKLDEILKEDEII
ncbi:MAG: 30S ribosomal protein S6 [Patescibacteria group bacterium]